MIKEEKENCREEIGKGLKEILREEIFTRKEEEEMIQEEGHTSEGIIEENQEILDIFQEIRGRFQEIEDTQEKVEKEVDQGEMTEERKIEVNQEMEVRKYLRGVSHVDVESV